MGVALAVAVFSSFVLSPGFSRQQTPELKKTDLNKPYRASSLTGFKAPWDFEVIDEAKTKQNREDARARVKMVFDLDPRIESEMILNVREAFARMQELVEPPPVVAPVLIPPVKAKPGEPKAVEPKEKADAAQLERLRAGLTEFWKTIEAPDAEDIDALLSTRFSPEVEAATVMLIEQAYRTPLALSREELTRLGTSNVTVRTIGAAVERDLGLLAPQVMDLREAGVELDRMASVPGVLLGDASAQVKRAVLRLAKKQLRPNLTVNTAETELRRRNAADAVKPVVLVLKKGQRLIGDGELVSESHLVLLQGLQAQAKSYDVWQLQFGSAAMVFLMLVVTFLFFRKSVAHFTLSKKDAVFLGALVLLGLLVARGVVAVGDVVFDRYPTVPVEALRFLFPMAAGAAVVRFLVSRSAALFFSIISSLLTGMLLGNSLSVVFVSLVSTFWCCTSFDDVKERTDIGKVALSTALSSGLAIFCAALAVGKGFSAETALGVACAVFSHALLIPVVVLVLTPLAEFLLGYASDFKLLELSSLNHPALKELVLQAPGTYHHSIILGSLVESAATVIGANPLLARACAYYHDIGKGRNAAYFWENQKTENPHEALTPVSSAVVIRKHVADGLELARQYRLPQRVTAVISQHHGTRLVNQFYQRALAESGGAQVDESVFRYSGPKPQSTEVALVMLADTVEAATRNVGELEDAAMKALVTRLFNELCAEGQLDECPLSMSDLAQVTDSFVATLKGLAHGRHALVGAMPGTVSGAALKVLPGGNSDNGKQTSA